MLQKIKKLAKGNLSISYVASIFTVVSALLSITLITNYSGIEVYGILSIIAATSGILINIFTVRTSEAVVRFLRVEDANNRRCNIKMILLTGFLFDLFLGFLIVLVFYLLSSLIANNFINDNALSYEVWIYSFITMFMFFGGTMSGYFKSKENFLFLNITIILESILKIAFLLIVFFIIKDGSLLNIIYTQILAIFMVTLMKFFYFIKEYKKEKLYEPLVINNVLLKEYMSFTLKTFTSSLLKAGNAKVDTLILAYFVDNKMVGIYEVIKKIVIVPINFMSMPFSMLYYPKLVTAFSLKKINDINDIIIKITFYLIISSTILFICSYMYLENILNLFNVVFLTEYSLWFSLIFVFYIPIFWWSRIFANATDPMYSIKSNLYSPLFIFTISLYSLFQYGIDGFLVSLVILKIILTLYWIGMLKKEMKVIT